jgi:hypothetical protein
MHDLEDHPHLLLASCVRVYVACLQFGDRLRHATAHGRSDRRLHSDRGQATTEYALVLLAAALVGLLVVGWATAGGGAGKVGRLFDRVIDSVIDKV